MSMIYRLFSRDARTVSSTVSSSTTDESLAVMDRELLLVRGDPSFRHPAFLFFLLFAAFFFYLTDSPSRHAIRVVVISKKSTKTRGLILPE